MNNAINKILNQKYLFNSERISVVNWCYIESDDKYNDLNKCVLEILTPKVTKDLPDGWQNIVTQKKAASWILERKYDSNFYAITLTKTKRIIGFLFLYIENETVKKVKFRLGYLLSDTIWGKGIGSELIKALVNWSKNTGMISSISGGVEKENTASIKVLIKNGFYKSSEVLPGNVLLYQIDF